VSPDSHSNDLVAKLREAAESLRNSPEEYDRKIANLIDAAIKALEEK